MIKKAIVFRALSSEKQVISYGFTISNYQIGLISLKLSLKTNDNRRLRNRESESKPNQKVFSKFDNDLTRKLQGSGITLTLIKIYSILIFVINLFVFCKIRKLQIAQIKRANELNEPNKDLKNI